MGKKFIGLVSEGCLQGKVLSQLLWSLVVNGLIRRLRRYGFYAVGYADDIVILEGGKCEDVLPRRLQEGLNRAKD